MNYVQAYISNISFPNSLDEVYNYAHFFNMRIEKPHGQHLSGVRKAILSFLCTQNMQIVKLVN